MFSVALIWRIATIITVRKVFKAHVPAVETVADTTTEEIWVKLKTLLFAEDNRGSLWHNKAPPMAT